MDGDEEDYERLADYLRVELSARHWSQSDLAREADVSLRTVNRIVNGRIRRTPGSMGRIESALGWTPGTARRIVEEGAEPYQRLRVDDPVIQQVLADMQYVSTLDLPQDVWRYLVERYEQHLADLRRREPEQ